MPVEFVLKDLYKFGTTNLEPHLRILDLTSVKGGEGIRIVDIRIGYVLIIVGSYSRIRGISILSRPEGCNADFRHHIRMIRIRQCVQAVHIHSRESELCICLSL